MSASGTAWASHPLDSCLLYEGDDVAASMELAQAVRSPLRQSLSPAASHLLSRPEGWWVALAGTGLHGRYRRAQDRLGGSGGETWLCLELALSCSVPIAGASARGRRALLPGVCQHQHLETSQPDAAWHLNTPEQCVQHRPLHAAGDGLRLFQCPMMPQVESCQEETLWRYGVCWDDWRCEVLHLSLPVPPTELPEAAAVKLTLLQRLGLPLQCPVRWACPERKAVTLPTELLSAVRLLLCMDWELYWHQYTASPIVLFVSHWNELKVFKYLRTQLGDLLRCLEGMQGAGPADSAQHSAGDKLDGDSAVQHYVACQAALARAALRQLQTLADAFSPLIGTANVAPESAVLQEFHQWFAESTGQDPVVRACEFISSGCGRGLRAERPVCAGQPVVQVPWDLVLSIDTALRSRHAPVYLQCGLEEEEILMVFLIHEVHDPSSKWASYFAVLPQSYQSPLLWTPAELLELDGSSVLEDIVQCRATLRESYDRRFPSLSHQHPDTFPEELFRFECWVRARCIFDSRCFKINVDGKAHNCLVPLADMVNHYPDGNVSYRRFDQESRCVTLDCLRDLPAGEEIRMNYGLLQNWESLMQYAMVDFDGPDDSVHFDLDIDGFSHDSATALHVQQLLTDAKLQLEHFLPHNGVPAPQLLATLRCLVMTPEDVHQAAAEAWDPAKCSPLSARNERRMVEAFVQIVEAMLQAYPTTLAEDEKRLAEGGDLYCPAGLALRFRLSQKRILHRSRAHAHGLLP
eukprot:GGOE01015125.1.p1 GENE.GGOE01015125.1~~GGOE01015125.1.p1  ORF type:complete len:759 (+),score=178.66 GGOE01015125.1:31-2277(+)